MALLFSGKFSVSPDVISETVLDETLLLNTQTLVYICLDELGGKLWHLLEQQGELETVFAAFAEQQNLSSEHLDRFLNDCIGGFQRAGFISLEQPATA